MSARPHVWTHDKCTVHGSFFARLWSIYFVKVRVSISVDIKLAGLGTLAMDKQLNTRFSPAYLRPHVGPTSLQHRYSLMWEWGGVQMLWCGHKPSLNHAIPSCLWILLGENIAYHPRGSRQPNATACFSCLSQFNNGACVLAMKLEPSST